LDDQIVKAPVVGVVFSRDRAMQLDGTLRSFFLHCRDADKVTFTVLYKATNAIHREQYSRLQSEYSRYGVKFVPESNFKSDLMDLVDPAMNGNTVSTLYSHCLRLLRPIRFVIGGLRKRPRENHVLFLVDDNLFVRDFDVGVALGALSVHQDCAGFTLRLGVNTTFCYPQRRSQTIPGFLRVAQDVLKFRWVSAEGDFAYPLEVSSSIYRAHDVLPWLSYIKFSNPNSLESALAGKARFFRKRQPGLLCYSNSVTFCNPANKVQTLVDNRAGAKTEYSAEQLSALFERGYRINIENYTGYVPSACHDEVDLAMTLDD
jgi:hypothetical protein